MENDKLFFLVYRNSYLKSIIFRYIKFINDINIKYSFTRIFYSLYDFIESNEKHLIKSIIFKETRYDELKDISEFFNQIKPYQNIKEFGFGSSVGSIIKLEDFIKSLPSNIIHLKIGSLFFHKDNKIIKSLIKKKTKKQLLLKRYEIERSANLYVGSLDNIFDELKELYISCEIIDPIKKLPEKLLKLYIYSRYEHSYLKFPDHIECVKFMAKSTINGAILQSIPSSIKTLILFTPITKFPDRLIWLNNSKYNLKKLGVPLELFKLNCFKEFENIFYNQIEFQYQNQSQKQKNVLKNIEYYNNKLSSIKSLSHLIIYFNKPNTNSQSCSINFNILPQSLKKLKLKPYGEMTQIMNTTGFGLPKTLEYFEGSFNTILGLSSFQDLNSIKKLTLYYFRNLDSIKKFYYCFSDSFDQKLDLEISENQSIFIYSKFKNLKSLSIIIDSSTLKEPILLPPNNNDSKLLNLELYDPRGINYLSDLDFIRNGYLGNSKLTCLKLDKVFTVALLKLILNKDGNNCNESLLPSTLELLDLNFDTNITRQHYIDPIETSINPILECDIPIISNDYLPNSLKVLIIRGTIKPSYKLNSLPKSLIHIFISYGNPILKDNQFLNSNSSIITPFSQDSDENIFDNSLSKFYEFNIDTYFKSKIYKKFRNRFINI